MCSQASRGLTPISCTRLSGASSAQPHLLASPQRGRGSYLSAPNWMVRNLDMRVRTWLSRWRQGAAGVREGTETAQPTPEDLGCDQAGNYRQPVPPVANPTNARPAGELTPRRMLTRLRAVADRFTRRQFGFLGKSGQPRFGWPALGKITEGSCFRASDARGAFPGCPQWWRGRQRLGVLGAGLSPSSGELRQLVRQMLRRWRGTVTTASLVLAQKPSQVRMLDQVGADGSRVVMGHVARPIWMRAPPGSSRSVRFVRLPGVADFMPKHRAGGLSLHREAYSRIKHDGSARCISS